MTPKLTDDLQQAIDERAGQPITVEHPVTHKLYVIVECDMHERAVAALRQQEDIAAIREGISQMEAGKGRPLAEVDADIRSELGLPPRT